jgi:hypothetical protein
MSFFRTPEDRINISVQHLGNEREPLVILDHCPIDTAPLVQVARQACYAPVHGYPGIRCRISSTYLAPITYVLKQVLADQFDMPNGAKVESCSFSIVTIPPDALSEGQRRPHYDDAQGNVLALLHFVDGPETGGTSFYRHRRTGFEAIHPERERLFAQGVHEDEREFGPLPAKYFHGDDERYEMIGHVDPAPGRIILYRGRQLHSGHILQRPMPDAAPAQGRLTINTFLVGER